MTPEWRWLVEVLDVSGFLACRSVFQRQRAAGRLMVRPAELSRALLAIQDLGLAACSGRILCQWRGARSGTRSAVDIGSDSSFACWMES